MAVRVLIVVRDLILRNHALEAAREGGAEAVTLNDPAQVESRIAAGSSLVLCDLQELAPAKNAEKFRRWQAKGARVWGLAPHAEEALLKAAKEAGLDKVVSYGAMHRSGQTLIEQAVREGFSPIQNRPAPKPAPAAPKPAEPAKPAAPEPVKQEPAPPAEKGVMAWLKRKLA